MKIKSKFKDYYDYVAHIYGGGDPMITYLRSRIGEVEVSCSGQYVRPLTINEFKMEQLNSGFTHINSVWREESLIKWLIVCGKPFALIKTSGDAYPEKYEVFDRKKHDHLVKSYHREGTPNGVERADLVELSKKVGHPVFIICDNDYRRRGINLVIDGDCPVLSDYGLASVYPAEQLYQDLSYFIVNTMKDSPDTAPRSVLDDKSKIEQHGFDLKKSFRHRK